MRLGYAHVNALARSLTAKQFQEWEAYALLEPFDEVRADYRAASIVTTLANVNRGERQAPFSLKDFLLNFEEPEQEVKPRRQTVDQQVKMAYMIAKAFNAPGINT